MSSTSQPELSNEEKREKVHSLLNSFHCCMMTTITPAGELHARPMATAKYDQEKELFFFLTEKTSPKTSELQNDQRVSLVFEGENKWVSVYGKAKTSQDRGKVKELWQNSYYAWFPNGPEDANLSLITVTPTKAEYWDSNRFQSLTIMYGMVKGLVTGEKLKPEEQGENETVRLHQASV